ncbi:alpha-glucuronidase [Chryseobacterium gambrini]|uniref:xylan alpha-1,2-glucuronosidase n=1 Tax=Chryseobacterium gambrini TaxID=373672 RepID=A0AAJ1VIT0_9FLAO|nr:MULTISPECIES: alpha-glucuronidase [Chryseobacterium]MDN4011011.1 alpha-glucuronidase [Chryseobacterium gambrini]MDN4028377.1 alpha-glucuronidase [Chryseobacterium gambrini]QWA38816.1 alpha-glucuronidase [Chryseobacterium sp. ZHDP1]
MQHFRHYILLFLIIPFMAWAEDGSQLWLRYPVNPKSRNIVNSNSKSPTIEIAKKELNQHWIGQAVDLKIDRFPESFKDGYRIISTPKKITVSAKTDLGLLYGSYYLLNLQQQKADFSHLKLEEKPSYDVRILNHWDNLDGTIERGYAGHSLWKWEDLPGKISPRYEEYARANASIGINATVLNNVNASPNMLREDYLKKVKILADIFRPYGIKVYLSVNFSSPKVLGGLQNSDPLNQEVQKWWKDKAAEIYKLIPDFGGFLVKANSEGQPGPQDYGRTHADGANMMADVLKPYGGIVMWRAFVYSPSKDDRAKQAHLEFVPLDGKFRDNVIIQIKNGPIDFQPREAFNPLFGALRKTSEMVEFQITQEYLGQANHLVFLAPLFKETLDSDTFSDGKGSTIAKITDGTLRPAKLTAIAAVANIGEDKNWTGHHFAQANWYAFGRLAWNHNLTSEQIADEWIKMTFTDQKNFVNPVKEIMLTSRETAVDYMMPLGLHHIFAGNHHYGPEPWGDYKGGRPDWSPVYYHQADAAGLGFDRTKTGSNAVSQYFPPLNEIYGNIKTTPENLILWFHHVSWDYKMKDGKTLWEELCYKYESGVKGVRVYQKTWETVKPYVDAERFSEIQDKLKIQADDSVWWKDACLLYFQTFSKRPIPADIEKPVHQLEDLKKIKLNMGHHN